MMIDGEPCKVLSLSKSKPGKHGSAKANITAVGLFDEQKRQWMGPADRDIEVPIIDKRKGQVIAELGGDKIQIMDMQDYNTFEAKVPGDYEGNIEQGGEIVYWRFGDRVLLK